MQEKENAAISGRHATWSGSVSTKAAFLEKQAQWTTLSGTKGVCTFFVNFFFIYYFNAQMMKYSFP